MKKLTGFIGLLLLMAVSVQRASGQYYFYDDKHYDNPLMIELGGSVGIMNCFTDLGGRKGIGKKFVKDLNLGKTQAAGSIFISANYKYAVSLRAEATFGQVTADDAVLKKVAPSTYGRYERNLSFKSTISEFMVAAEFHPLFIFKPKDDDDWEPPMFSPYLMGGIGFFHFNPQAKLDGKWIDLQPLTTEGQGSTYNPDAKPYKLNQVSIPVGVGVRYELSSTLNLRAEFVYRILNTDYLDDVSTTYVDPTYFDKFTAAKRSNALLLFDRQKELDQTHNTVIGGQRGNPNNNDAFFTFNVKIGYTFGREKIR
jgi:hypothetical protein